MLSQHVQQTRIFVVTQLAEPHKTAHVDMPSVDLLQT